MSTEIFNTVLWIAIVWPLLLAMPALHARLPWPRHLAVIPATVLMLLPGEGSLQMPHLLFGTGLAIDNEIRWILAMSITVWLIAATMTTATRCPAHNRTTTLFLLTLAGNLGAILSADLTGFFTFTTLMGYSFYGLLLQEKKDGEQYAARLYLIFLIIADLALFEALLLASSTTGDLRFAAVRMAMAETSFSQLYLAMILAAFALKAGVWPFHLWLSTVFRTVPQPTTPLLVGIPVAMGLLGALRWLPSGGHDYYVLGIVILLTGIAGILYAAFRIFTQASVLLWPARATVGFTGLFTALLGTGLAYPLLWRQYEYLAYPFVAAMGILLTVLTFVVNRLQQKQQHPDAAIQRLESLFLWARRCTNIFQQRSNEGWLRASSLWRISWQQAAGQYQRILGGKKMGGSVAGWSARVTMFVLVGLLLAWLAG